MRDFALALVTDIRNESGYVKLFTARYSGELLAGNTLDAGDTKHGVRAKVIKLYRDACPCRKSNPDILVVEPSKNWATKNASGPFHSTRDRRVLLQG